MKNIYLTLQIIILILILIMYSCGSENIYIKDSKNYDKEELFIISGNIYDEDTYTVVKSFNETFKNIELEQLDEEIYKFLIGLVKLNDADGIINFGIIVERPESNYNFVISGDLIRFNRNT